MGVTFYKLPVKVGKFQLGGVFHPPVRCKALGKSRKKILFYHQLKLT